MQSTLNLWKEQALQRFSELGGFSFEQEAFNYVSSIRKLNFPPNADEKGKIDFCSDKQYRIVFIDGFFSHEHSHLPEDVVCLSLDDAMQSYGVLLQKKFAQKEADPLALLNAAYQGLGAFLYIPPGREINEPIFIEHVFSSNDVAHARLFVFAGKHTKTKCIQRLHGKKDFFANNHLDATLEAGAHLEVKNIFNKIPKAHIFQSTRGFLKRDSNFIWRAFSEGAELSRNSIEVDLLEENSNALLEGVTNLDEKRQSHIHACVRHFAPHAESKQHFKALCSGRSRSSFEGKIYVHPIAQKNRELSIEQ